MPSTPLWIISGIVHSINCPKPSSQGTYLARYLDHTSLKISLSINAIQKLKQVCSCVISGKRTHPNKYFFSSQQQLGCPRWQKIVNSIIVVLVALHLYLLRYPLFSFQICYLSFSFPFSHCLHNAILAILYLGLLRISPQHRYIMQTSILPFSSFFPLLLSIL